MNRETAERLIESYCGYDLPPNEEDALERLMKFPPNYFDLVSQAGFGILQDELDIAIYGVET